MPNPTTPPAPTAAERIDALMELVRDYGRAREDAATSYEHGSRLGVTEARTRQDEALHDIETELRAALTRPEQERTVDGDVDVTEDIDAIEEFFNTACTRLHECPVPHAAFDRLVGILGERAALASAEPERGATPETEHIGWPATRATVMSLSLFASNQRGVLRRVQNGERITLTQRGKRVAMLGPVSGRETATLTERLAQAEADSTLVDYLASTEWHVDMTRAGPVLMFCVHAIAEQPEAEEEEAPRDLRADLNAAWHAAKGGAGE